jgi:hypothetical protein
MKELEEKAREMERLHSAIDGGLRRVREVELVSRPMSAIQRLERTDTEVTRH